MISRHKLFNHNNLSLRLQIWEFNPETQPSLLEKDYFKKIKGIVLVFSLEDQNSFESISSQVGLFRQNGHKDTPIIAIGNYNGEGKSNSNRNEVEKGINEMGVDYCEVNVKDDKDVGAPFSFLLNKIIEMNAKRRAESFEDHIGMPLSKDLS